MRGPVALLLLSGVCGCDAAGSRTEAPAPTSSGASSEPGSTWTVIDRGRADVRDAVVAASREATRHGLVPVLYLTADYTMAGSWLKRLRGEAPMRDALKGVAVLEVDPELGYEDLTTGYWHSFHALDQGGKPTGATLDPHTKRGPCTDGDAGECAAWIRAFTRSLPRAPGDASR